MKDKCLDTIFKLLNSAKNTESINSVMYLLTEVFTERIDDAIAIFNKIIERDDIKPQVYSTIGTGLLKQLKVLTELNPEFVDSIYKNYKIPHSTVALSCAGVFRLCRQAPGADRQHSGTTCKPYHCFRQPTLLSEYS